MAIGDVLKDPKHAVHYQFFSSALAFVSCHYLTVHIKS